MTEQIKKNAVAVNAFVRRQTKESPFSYYDGKLEDLATRLEVVLCDLPQRRCYVRPGHKDGVIFVNLAPVKFYSGARSCGPKVPAKVVDVVLYRRDVLEEADRSPAVGGVFAEWELISIHASATECEAPLHPLVMARNMLGKPGGTRASYTAQEFAEAIWFWSKHTLSAGDGA